MAVQPGLCQTRSETLKTGFLTMRLKCKWPRVALTPCTFYGGFFPIQKGHKLGTYRPPSAPSFPIFSKFPIYSYILIKSPIFSRKADNHPRKSCFHRNLQLLPMSWGPGGPQTPAELQSLIFLSQHSVLSSQRGPEMFLVCILKCTKKFGHCLIVLKEVLCMPVIAYITPIFLTLISYIFELKMYILHQSAVGSLHLILVNFREITKIFFEQTFSVELMRCIFDNY